MENEVKEPAPKYNYISPEEYLEIERAAEYKNEYYYGQILAMSGASLRHSRIDLNETDISLHINTINYYLPLSEIYDGTGL